MNAGTFCAVANACLAYVVGFLLVCLIDQYSAADLGRVVIGYFFIASALLLAYAAGQHEANRKRAP